MALFSLYQQKHTTMDNKVLQTNNTTATLPIITKDELLEHWQGHRRLTRRFIEAFPEEQLFQFSIGGMRPFSALAVEMIWLASGIHHALTGEWPQGFEIKAETIPTTKAGLLAEWDRVTADINATWPAYTEARFHETTMAFGMYEGPVYSIVMYWIDNEIHHRGQGSVYLRALGIEPPAFWDRN